MKRYKAFIGGVLLFVSVFFIAAPQFVFAAECDCYCATMDYGAVPISNAGDNRIYEDLATCDYMCEYWYGDGALMCATHESQLPQYNTYCFKEDMCAKQNGKWSESQAPDCLLDYRYCYPDPAKDEDLKLAVSIGEMSQPEDLAEYVQNVYSWLLGASLLVAIVMIMVSGLQWVLSASGTSAESAKTRMKSSVVGVVLLMAVSMILYTVNPQLLALQMEDLPMIRGVYFLDDSVKCENFLKAGYTVDPDRSALTESCGEDVSKVTKDAAGVEIPEDEQVECEWSTCPVVPTPHSNMQASSVCLVHPSSGDNVCVGCWDVVADNDLDVMPSPAVCEALTPEPITRGDQFSCVHTLDGGFSQASTLSAATEGQCALIGFNCGSIDSCSEYDTIQTVNNDGVEDLDGLREGREGITEELGEYIGSYAENWVMEFPHWIDMCNANVCGFNGGCTPDTSGDWFYASSYTVINDCISTETAEQNEQEEAAAAAAVSESSSSSMTDLYD
jgi:hypothetical protein